MRHAAAICFLMCACFALLSCHRAREPLDVRIPAGLVTATEAQTQLVAKLKTLSRGMSVDEVKRELGPATEEKRDTLFYHLSESRVEGGYYVDATLTFHEGDLAEVEVGFGHETRGPAAGR